jgi:hypothetical protein
MRRASARWGANYQSLHIISFELRFGSDGVRRGPVGARPALSGRLAVEGETIRQIRSSFLRSIAACFLKTFSTRLLYMVFAY